MNCQNCGANVDGKAFCSHCGTPVQAAPAPQQYYNGGYPQPPQPAAPQGNPTNVLVFGIIGLALSELGIVGLIFSIIGLKKANAYLATYGDISNQVRHGRRLAIAGLVISIIMTVFWTLYFILIIVAVANGGATVTTNYTRYY